MSREPDPAEIDQLVALFNARQFVGLEDRTRALIERYPDSSFGWKAQGSLLSHLGRSADALVSLQQAAILHPVDAEIYNNRGITLNALDRLEEATKSYQRACRVAPDYAEAYYNLGITLQGMRRLEDAIYSYRCALLLKPDHASAYNNLGNLCQEIGRLREAEASCRAALQIRPRYAEACYNLGITLQDLGHLDEAQAKYVQALNLKPDYLEAIDNLLLLLNYVSDCSATQYLGWAGYYGERVRERVAAKFTSWSCPEQPTRLRVGFVSGDIGNHPVGYFLESLLNCLDPASMELLAYPTVDRNDEVTARIRYLVASWKPLYGMGDGAAAQLIHDDGVHVLIDLSGHTRGNRLPVFAWKPAPVQVSWLGYFASTGVKEIDYFLGDRYTARTDEACHFTEKLWQLPECHMCFTAPDVPLEVAPLPARTSGEITFGCFNNLTKINDAVITVWTKILRALPRSRLFLKTRQLAEASIRETTRRRFAGLGVGADRLIMEGWSPREEYLAAYHHVDIALDPFPYPGGTTSIEALWMGVPTITKRGDRFLAHQGESIAHHAGLSDWIAADEEEYVSKAIAFASDPDQLAHLRSGLRQQLLTSPLIDAPRFAQHFEAALRDIWTQWCNQHQPQSS